MRFLIFCNPPLQISQLHSIKLAFFLVQQFNPKFHLKELQRPLTLFNNEQQWLQNDWVSKSHITEIGKWKTQKNICVGD